MSVKHTRILMMIHVASAPDSRDEAPREPSARTSARDAVRACAFPCAPVRGASVCEQVFEPLSDFYFSSLFSLVVLFSGLRFLGWFFRRAKSKRSLGFSCSIIHTYIHGWFLVHHWLFGFAWFGCFVTCSVMLPVGERCCRTVHKL
jgi:hypothetical protein